MCRPDVCVIILTKETAFMEMQENMFENHLGVEIICGAWAAELVSDDKVINCGGLTFIYWLW